MKEKEPELSLELLLNEHEKLKSSPAYMNSLSFIPEEERIKIAEFLANFVKEFSNNIILPLREVAAINQKDKSS